MRRHLIFLNGESLEIQRLTERTNRKCLVKYVRRTFTWVGNADLSRKSDTLQNVNPRTGKSLLFSPTTFFTRHTYEMTFDIRYFVRFCIFNIQWFKRCYRYQFFLQLKQDILQGRVPVSQELMAELGAYVVQCEYKYMHAYSTHVQLYAHCALHLRFFLCMVALEIRLISPQTRRGHKHTCVWRKKGLSCFSGRAVWLVRRKWIGRGTWPSRRIFVSTLPRIVNDESRAIFSFVSNGCPVVHFPGALAAGTDVERYVVDTSLGAARNGTFALTGGFSPSGNFALRTILLAEIFSFFTFCQHIQSWRSLWTVKIGFATIVLFGCSTISKHVTNKPCVIRTMGKIKRLPFFFFFCF